MIELLMNLKHSLWHNINCIVETTVVWFIWLWCYSIGDIKDLQTHVIINISVHEVVVYLIPYIQFVSLFAATGASFYTIYKIRKDLKK